jgi:hypothetical protein
MNRTQRRNINTKVKNRTYTFTEEQLQKYIMTELETIKKSATYSAIEGLMGSVIISLCDEFGFGAKRINKFIDKLNNQYECVERGDVTLDDFNAWALEKGINYKIKMGGK